MILTAILVVGLDTLVTLDDSVGFEMRNDIKKAVGCLCLVSGVSTDSTPLLAATRGPFTPVRATAEWDYRCGGVSFIANNTNLSDWLCVNLQTVNSNRIL